MRREMRIDYWCIPVFLVMSVVQPTFAQSINSIGVNSKGHIFICPWERGVLRSTDDGVHWRTSNANIADSSYGSFIVSINRTDNILAAGGYGSVYRSTNNGDSWTKLNITTNGTYCVGSNGKEHIFLGTSTGIFRSTDDGLSWTKLSQGLVYDPAIVSLLIQDSSTILAGCFTIGPQGTEFRIARSSDNGDNWQTVDSTHAVYSFCSMSGDTILAGTYGSGILCSGDRGANWSSFDNTATYFASILATPRYVFAGSRSGGGISRCLHTSDSMHTVNSGLLNTTIYCLAVTSDGDVLAGSGDGLFRSSNSGYSWSTIPLLTSVRRDVAVSPGPFRFEKSYPNPFNPSTVLRFYTAMRGHVILAI